MTDVLFDGNGTGEFEDRAIYTRGARNDKELLFRYLDTNGDGTGVISTDNNHSGAPVSYYIQPPTGEQYVISRMIIYFQDRGSIDSGAYGNGITLTNGIQVSVTTNNGATLITNMTGGQPIIYTTDWMKMCYDGSVFEDGSGAEAFSARWTFEKTGQRGVVLNGNNNDRLEVILNDNFSGLNEQTFFVQGYKETPQ